MVALHEWMEAVKGQEDCCESQKTESWRVVVQLLLTETSIVNNAPAGEAGICGDHLPGQDSYWCSALAHCM